VTPEVIGSGLLDRCPKAAIVTLLVNDVRTTALQSAPRPLVSCANGVNLTRDDAHATRRMRFPGTHGRQGPRCGHIANMVEVTVRGQCDASCTASRASNA
jgi:hypothetical protein